MNYARLSGLLAAFAVAATSFAQTPAAAQPPASVAPPPAAARSAPAVPAKGADAMEGVGAVYSDKLVGRKTASGQAFSQSALTAAHPALPFGTKVRVTNTKNSKSVEVRINDRGPMHAGRVIDLSRAAAAKIGIGKNGTAPVKLEVVGEQRSKEGKKAAN